jgi:hypothetical protein
MKCCAAPLGLARFLGAVAINMSRLWRLCARMRVAPDCPSLSGLLASQTGAPPHSYQCCFLDKLRYKGLLAIIRPLYRPVSLSR